MVLAALGAALHEREFVKVKEPYLQMQDATNPIAKGKIRWRLKPRETRLLVYLLVLLAVAAWKFLPRPWWPKLTLDAPHHTIYSTVVPHGWGMG
jgi:hypothetical protein